jgi:putative ABC transport system permease protein
MIKFLLKGLIRDSSRSRLPIIVVMTGVALTVLMHAYITGIMGDTIDVNARFFTGHLKVMTRAYSENADQVPNDLALTGVDSLVHSLKEEFPFVEWSSRIHFGGLLDVPDEEGETRSQGPVIGMGVDLLGGGSKEISRLNLDRSLVRGKLPSQKGEALLTEDFSRKLEVNPGDTVTLISSGIDGSMAFYNFVISGTVSIGYEAMDRGAMFADIMDVRNALNMEHSAGEITGFFKDGYYNDALAKKDAASFNNKFKNVDGEFVPVMVSLSGQANMETYVTMLKYWSAYVAAVFVFAMSLVLWNAGLLGGLRRYGEIGIRLAMGEEKGHVYRSMIYESVMIGIAGSVAGTAIGLFFAYLIQKHGINISGMMQGSSAMIPSVIRARITPVDFYLGFIPGLISTVIGTMLSGIGIYKRQTASLFKELEV